MNRQELNMIESRPQVNPFAFALLLDEQGHEIAITEDMIRKACEDLAKRCQFPAGRQAA